VGRIYTQLDRQEVIVVAAQLSLLKQLELSGNAGLPLGDPTLLQLTALRSLERLEIAARHELSGNYEVLHFKSKVSLICEECTHTEAYTVAWHVS
jgi:hypothetical protein